METQRLRNLTTGKLHTEMSHIYQDMEFLIGEKGLFTHMLPNAFRAMEPWLREKVTDSRYWDNEYDPDHSGSYDIAPMNNDERSEFWKRYSALPSPFGGKEVITAIV